MRAFLSPLIALSALCPLVVAAAKDAKEIDALITQLGDDNADKRAAAAKKLEEIGEPAVEALRKAAKSHPDVDVRLRAGLVLRALDEKSWGEVRHFGEDRGYWLNRVAFLPDGKHVLATGGAVIVYDLESGKELRRSMEKNFARTGLVLMNDGKQFLTGHQYDAVLRQGEVASLKEERSFGGHKGGLWAVALSRDEKLAASGGEDGLIRVWDLKGGKESASWTVGNKVRCLAFTPDGKHVLSGHFGPGADLSIRLWDAATGKEVRRYKGHTAEVTSLVVLPGGKEFLSSSMDGTVRRWDLEKGTEVAKLEHKGGVREVAVSPDGKRALSGGFGDHKVRVWDLRENKELHCFDGHKGAVLGVAFSPDGKRAVSSDSQCMIHLWRLSP